MNLESVGYCTPAHGRTIGMQAFENLTADADFAARLRAVTEARGRARAGKPGAATRLSVTKMIGATPDAGGSRRAARQASRSHCWRARSAAACRRADRS